MRQFFSISGAIIIFAATMSSVAYASNHAASSAGFVEYEKDGQVMKRDVTMTMERTGEGEARFVLSSGNWTIESTRSFMRESRGAKLAYVAFENAWQMDGEVKHLLFKGVKLKGENRMVYQGTLFKTSPEQLALSGETFAECLQNIKESGSIDEDWKISGTFYFQKDLAQTFQ